MSTSRRTARTVLHAFVAFALGTALLAAPLTALAAPGMNLVGAGSTFVYPFFSVAFAEYAKGHPVTVNYQGIGSGGGIKQYTEGTVDFGASDVPMNDAELKAADATGGETIQIPVALGGIAIIYNLPEIGPRPLHLDATTLASIYEAKITTWNDPAIARLNPRLKLPATSILPVHRSDGSGTNYIFTDYLSTVSADFKKSVGTGKSVAWPSGEGGKGNPGLATAVQQHPGAIGYVELAYAIENHIAYAQIKNKAGHFEYPTQGSVRAAAGDFPKTDFKNFSIVNAPGPFSYPIAGYAWVMVRKHPKDPARGKAVIELLRWTTTEAQHLAQKLQYVPLPSAIQKEAANLLQSIG